MTSDMQNPDIEPSEELDQLQAEDTLEDRGVEDILDEGIVTRERWSPGQGFGNTAAEQSAGETLDQRLAQEEPEEDPDAWDEDDLDDGEVGDARSGRLVEGSSDGFKATDTYAEDVGIDGGASSAEEAAMHVIPDDGSF